MTNKNKDLILQVRFTQSDFIIDNLNDKAENIDDQLYLSWHEKFTGDKFKALFYLGFLKPQTWFSESLNYLYQISKFSIEKIAHHPFIEDDRDKVTIQLSDVEIEELILKTPYAIGVDCIDESWIKSLFENLIAIFSADISVFDGDVNQYFLTHNDQINVAGRVFFHLVEHPAEDTPFAFMATYSNKSVKSKKTTHTPLKNALLEFKDDHTKLIELISSVTKVAEESEFISDLLESGELFAPILLNTQEAYTFLSESSMYESSGIMCRMPDWWRKKNSSINLSVSVGEKKPSQVGLDAMMDFAPTLIVGGETLTEKELRDFLTMADGLIQYKGKWVEINKSKLEAALLAFEKLRDFKSNHQLTFAEAIKMELNVEEILGIESEDIDISVSNGQWLRTVKESLVNPMSLEKVKTASSFHATLRNYQDDGYQWLQNMTKLQLGACLADDMGLGKTVQIIALLEHKRTTSGGQVLLVLPASLIGNWQNEIEKFASSMPYQILHASSGNKEFEIDPGAFLCITTYAMAKRIEALQEKVWDILILDEAQAIKNPGTKQTKIIKSIPSSMRIAMTGTPIENSLGDLWSLFDFLNPGLLGNAKEFKKFTKTLNDDFIGYSKLKNMIHPFLLRRLKTDKSIISDLPDKIEINEYSALSKKQILLYKRLVNQIEVKLETAQGIEKKGLVLSSIMKLKQICNHPDQYLGKEDYKPAGSGKFSQLEEICNTIYQKRERVIVFTQFREMVEPLSEFLQTIFQREGLTLHGGTPVKKRSKMVDIFNDEPYVPYMVLSLKAGGVGLNLTKANHVVHFDRWWNPAVENQATDRAFRIGQTKNVMVHKFVTKGTIEEKIDKMINDKKQLAADVLSTSGEGWITELDNEALIELFTLGGN